MNCSSNATQIIYLTRFIFFGVPSRYGHKTAENPKNSLGITPAPASSTGRYSVLDNDYTQQLFSILIPVAIILSLILIFLIVLLINPKLAVWMKPLNINRKKGLLGLIQGRNRQIGATGTDRVNNNYTMTARNNSVRSNTAFIPIFTLAGNIGNADEQNSRNQSERAINYAFPPPPENTKTSYTEVTIRQI